MKRKKQLISFSWKQCNPEDIIKTTKIKERIRPLEHCFKGCGHYYNWLSNLKEREMPLWILWSTEYKDGKYLASEIMLRYWSGKKIHHWNVRKDGYPIWTHSSGREMFTNLEINLETLISSIDTLIKPISSSLDSKKRAHLEPYNDALPYAQENEPSFYRSFRELFKGIIKLLK